MKKFVLLVIITLTLLLIALFFFARGGYGGNPSGFLVEGDTLYVIDSGIHESFEGAPRLPIKTKPAVWVVDLKEEKLKTIKKFSDNKDEVYQGFYKSRIQNFQERAAKELTVKGKTFTLNVRDYPGEQFTNKIQLKDENGNLKEIEIPDKKFWQLFLDNSGNIYLYDRKHDYRGDTTEFLYLFDESTNQVTASITLPSRNFISQVQTIDSKIYIVGQSQDEKGNTVAFFVSKYDKSSGKLQEIQKINRKDVLSAVHDRLLFYSQKGSIDGFQPPKVTIYDLSEEKKIAEVIGNGLGPNPIIEIIKTGLAWVLFFLFLPVGLINSLIR